MDTYLWNIEEYTNKPPFRGQPYEKLLWLQEHKPVAWSEDYFDGPGFWAITRHADVKAVEADSLTFSSEPTSMLHDENVHGDGVHKSVIFSDPPSHTGQRKFLQEEVTPAAVRKFAPDVERVVTEIIDNICERGECDLVSDVSGPLAAYVTADLMGLPREELIELYDIAERINGSGSLSDGEGAAAMADMAGVATRIFNDRRACPKEDLVTRFAHGEYNGCPVDAAQFALDFLVYSDAGNDTTRNLFGAGMEALCDFPEQKELLLSDLSLIPKAVEEILRFSAPIVYQRRTATKDTEIAGQEIKQGQKVVMFYGAANRDPRVFTDPNTFDITRHPNLHLGFGAGRHFCMGAHLARQELQIMYRELFRRLPDIERADQTQWLPENPRICPVIVGPRSMPMRFTPAPKSTALPSREPVLS
ncbi:cytochrome P450 [Rhodococcus koreensis]